MKALLLLAVALINASPKEQDLMLADLYAADPRLAVEVLEVADDVGVVLGGHRRAVNAYLQARARGRAVGIVGVEEVDAQAVGIVPALGLVGRPPARGGRVGARRGDAVADVRR